MTNKKGNKKIIKKDLKKNKKKIENVVNDFKDFASKGNIIDMAIGLTMGTAFTKIVNSIVSEILTPVLGYITKGIDFNTLFFSFSKTQYDTIEHAKEAGVITVNYGVCITAIIDFLVIALFIFIAIKIKNRAFKKLVKNEEKVTTETTKECPYCLSVINIKATRCPHCTNILDGYAEQVKKLADKKIEKNEKIEIKN